MAKSVEEIKASLDDLSIADLQNLQNDDRPTVRDLASKALSERVNEGPVLKPIEEYDPRKDPGPERYEDQMEPPYELAEVTSPEVPLEESRKDETTVLASDVFDAEGNRVGAEEEE